MFDSLSFFSKTGLTSIIGACCMTGIAAASLRRFIRGETLLLALSDRHGRNGRGMDGPTTSR